MYFVRVWRDRCFGYVISNVYPRSEESICFHATLNALDGVFGLNKNLDIWYTDNSLWFNWLSRFSLSLRRISLLRVFLLLLIPIGTQRLALPDTELYNLLPTKLLNLLYGSLVNRRLSKSHLDVYTNKRLVSSSFRNWNITKFLIRFSYLYSVKHF